MSDLKCRECGHTELDWLGDHLAETHSLGLDEYEAKHPGAPVASKRLLAAEKADAGNVRREHPTAPDKLTVELMGMEFPVNVGVPAEVCLPEPHEYRLPRAGRLARDVARTLTSLLCGRSIYAWGQTGSGKDALFHYWSAVTRTPAIIKQTIPGTDIESWFFSRGFNESGTRWEEGDVLKALRDGYLLPDGRRVPYMLLVSDFDRADRAQAEHFRLITDSIEGRISGPAGQVYKVLPGTIIVATANTAGGGDPRGRMLANPIDASILGRFDVKVEFHWMEWKDEEPIVRAKFPFLVEKAPWVFERMGKATSIIRQAIYEDSIYSEFSHRDLCGVLRHAEDLLRCSRHNKVPPTLLKMGFQTWFDGLPDPDTRKDSEALVDPYLKGGMIDEGDTSHIKDGEVLDF